MKAIPIPYKFPPATLLAPGKSKKGADSREELRETAVKLVETLKSFGVEVKLLQVDPFNSTADRVVGMVPDVVDKISGLFSKKDKKKKEQPEEKPAKSSIDDIDLSDPLV